MMELVNRKISEMRRLWERGKLGELDWGDLEWELEQASVEYLSLLTHLRHLEQEIEDLPDETEMEQRLYHQREKIEDLLDTQKKERSDHRVELITAATREAGLHRELAESRAELARAREEAELLTRSKQETSLFEEERTDSVA